MTRKRKAPKSAEKAKKFKEYVEVEPDPNSEEFYYDEIDQFNMDKEKILLGDTLKPRKKQKAEEVEVFPVADDYDSDENEENIQMWEKQIKQLRMHSSSKAALIAPNDFTEAEKEDEKPRATTWGRKKADEYGADVVDDVDISDSEENNALLEEKEAAAIQKQQLDHIDESYFDFDRCKRDMATVFKSTKTVQKDESNLSLDEKREALKKENPELIPIYLDTALKCKEVRKTLCPIVQAYEKGLLPKHELFDYLQTKLGLYLIHFANVAFYRALKLEQANTKNHPVIAAIFSGIEKIKNWKKIDQTDAAAIQYVRKMMKKGKPELVTVETLSSLLGADTEPETPTSSKRVTFAEVNGCDAEEFPDEDEANAADDDRIVDYKIEKNKGITPKRKKANRNPRVKYRQKYRKALIRQRGQKPQMRSQNHPYAGEISGISIGVKKGIRLKA